ncbi:MAG: hypothetical protein DMF93_16395 [Acidobacteria bacterium]|nr:MAG: hypothetical protein DMF93_16395 [Acidobacteriota bacterium]
MAAAHLGGRRRHRPLQPRAAEVGEARELRRLLQFLPRLLHRGSIRGGRHRLEHRLSGRRQQFLRAPRRADVGARAPRQRRPAGEDLRAYLLKGGFIIVDDFWGTRAWEQWAYEIGRVLPPHQYPIVDIEPTHPVMNVLYDVKDVEQVSNIRFWVQTGSTSERGGDSAHVNFRGISDEKGRLMVVMAHNTDIPDTWEREGESKEYFDKFSPNGYAVGVNVVLYGLTH